MARDLGWVSIIDGENMLNMHLCPSLSANQKKLQWEIQAFSGKFIINQYKSSIISWATVFHCHIYQTVTYFEHRVIVAIITPGHCLTGRLLPACLVAAACGLQNAMCTSHFGGIVRTSHVTGTVTDLGSILGRISMIYLRKSWGQRQLNEIEAGVLLSCQFLVVLIP